MIAINKGNNIDCNVNCNTNEKANIFEKLIIISFTKKFRHDLEFITISNAFLYDFDKNCTIMVCLSVRCVSYPKNCLI